MKIAIISSGCRPVLDGVTISLHQRLQKLGDLDHQVLVICPDYKELSELYPDFQDWSGNILPGVNVINLPSDPIPGADFDMNYSRKANGGINSALSSFQPDIIHVDEPERIAVGIWNAPGVSFARANGVPISAMFHTNFVDMDLEEQGQSKLLQWMAPFVVRWVYRSYDATLVSNSVVEKRVNQLGVDNTLGGQYIGVDLAAFRSHGKEPTNFLRSYDLNRAAFKDKVVLAFVCRLNPDKGWPFILHSFKQFALDQPDWLERIALVIAGGGELHDQIEQTFKELNIPTVMLGRVLPEHMPLLLERADVCVDWVRNRNSRSCND